MIGERRRLLLYDLVIKSCGVVPNRDAPEGDCMNVDLMVWWMAKILEMQKIHQVGVYFEWDGLRTPKRGQALSSLLVGAPY